VLRFAHQAAAEAHANLQIIHAIQAAGPDLPIQLDLDEEIQSKERKHVREFIADLQQRVGSQAPVQLVVGLIKEALLEAARQFDADVLVIGRSPQSGAIGRLRDLTYVMVRDSPLPVMSV
jgi:nucleotide-binding universal stress UspA family protein